MPVTCVVGMRLGRSVKGMLSETNKTTIRIRKRMPRLKSKLPVVCLGLSTFNHSVQESYCIFAAVSNCFASVAGYAISMQISLFCKVFT